MFAVVTKVQLPEGATIAEGRKQLESDVIPRLKQAPGFVSALFLSPREGREGLSAVVFDTEEQANQAKDRMEIPEELTLLSSEVQEVAAKV